MAKAHGRLKMGSIQEILHKRNLETGGSVQQYIDSEVLRLSTPYIPLDKGALIASGTENTTVGSGKVIWKTPYARRWYYEPANFQGAPMRGNYWFEEMKNLGGKEKIGKGAAKIAGLEYKP